MLGFGLHSRLAGGSHPAGCRCCATPQATSENLEELEFLRSACTAAQTGQVDKLREIISRHPQCIHTDGTSSGTSGYTPLHYAARAGHVEAMRLLIDAGADVDRQTSAGGSTPLHRAAYTGHVEAAQLLLRHGANPLLQDSDGETPLHKAAAKGYKEMIAILKEAGPAALMLRDRHSLTPLGRAVPGSPAAALLS